MGLDTTHDCWSGGYTSFGMFRDVVGKAARLPHRKPNLMLGEYGLDVLAINWDSVTERQIQGHWGRRGPTVEAADIYSPPVTDPVLYLLVHSDCDGKLRRGYLPALKARLEEIEPEYERLIPKMPAGYARLSGALRRFINGLDAAIEAGEHVEFH